MWTRGGDRGGNIATPGHIRTMRPVRTAIAITVLALTGCSTTDATPPATTTTTTLPGRKATPEQASALADVLTRNHDLGGADFEVTIEYGVAIIKVVGQVDFAGHVGSATVSASTEAPPVQIVFGQNIVVEKIDSLASTLEAANLPPANWMRRPLRTSTSPLDIVLAIVLSASATQRDNPVLLLQDGLRFVGTKNIDGVTCQGLTRGSATYWVGDDGLLHRLEARLVSTKSIADISFTNHGPRKIDEPSQTDVVDRSEVEGLVAAPEDGQ